MKGNSPSRAIHSSPHKSLTPTHSQDAFESHLTELIDNVVNKLVVSIGSEMKEIKKAVRNTENSLQFDPFTWSSKVAMAAQRAADRRLLLQDEEQQEVVVEI